MGINKQFECLKHLPHTKNGRVGQPVLLTAAPSLLVGQYRTIFFVAWECVTQIRDDTDSLYSPASAVTKQVSISYKTTPPITKQPHVPDQLEFLPRIDSIPEYH